MVKSFVQPVIQGVPDVLVAVPQCIGVKFDLHLSRVFQGHIPENLDPQALTLLQFVTVLKRNHKLIRECFKKLRSIKR
ncbi:hypothetical protein D3C84_609450 [compost metagenome]